MSSSSNRVWLDKSDGALEGMAATAIAIESATLTVDWVKSLRTTSAQRGIRLLDAPVAGSRPQAEAGQLIYMVGGDRAAFNQAKPLLLQMGAAAHYTGPSGSGAAVKLMVNALFGIQLATIAELIGLVRRLGFDETRAFEVLTATPVCSPAVKAAADAMLKGDYTPMFPLELVEKDFAYAAHTAESKEAQIPIIASARKVFSQALDRGHGTDNITGVVKLYR